MKWILFFNLVVLLGLSLANIQENIFNQGSSLFGEGSVTQHIKRGAPKRVARDTSSSLDSSLQETEAIVISSCKAAGHINEANQLQSAYDEMKTCLKKKTIFITPKDEFIANFEECSNESIKRTKSCLATDQKYFPEFALVLVKSGINFWYKYIVIARVDMAACAPRLNRYSVQRSYNQCLRTHDTDNIPTSKASFCDKVIAITRCFTDMIKETCDRTPILDQFREDNINAMKDPCDKEE